MSKMQDKICTLPVPRSTSILVTLLDSFRQSLWILKDKRMTTRPTDPYTPSDSSGPILLLTGGVESLAPQKGFIGEAYFLGCSRKFSNYSSQPA